MWQIYCRVRHSIGFSGNVTLAATLGHGGSWARLLRHRFGNDTKTEQAQSQIMSMQQGKNETAHDYALRFETVLEKIPLL